MDKQDIANIELIIKTSLTKLRGTSYAFEREAVLKNAVYEAYLRAKVKEKGL